MPNPNRTPATRNAELTNERFRELAEEAVAELHANSDVFETHDLRTWCRKLRQTLGKQVNYEANDGGDLDGMLLLNAGES